jgi:predicted ribosome quality control (RQC) complex YloA/Tae2 family protein
MNMSQTSNQRIPLGYTPTPREFKMGNPFIARNQKHHAGIVDKITYSDDISFHTKDIRKPNNLDEQGKAIVKKKQSEERELRPIGMVPMTSSKFNRF